MGETEYSEAAVEVLDILNYTNKEEVEKIPQSFIKFLTNIASRTYKVNFNHEQPINGLNLKKETRELLGFIYITWWSDKEEREKYKKQIHEINIKKEEIKENYNINEIFKNRKQNQEQKIIENKMIEQTSLIEYKKESVFRKIINKIISFFNSKNGGK